MLSESESVICGRFCPLVESSCSIFSGVVLVGGCCVEGKSVLMPVGGGSVVVAVDSVCGASGGIKAVGSGLEMSWSWSVS